MPEWRPIERAGETDPGICQYRGYRFVWFFTSFDTLILLSYICLSSFTFIRNPWNMSDPAKPEEKYTYSPHYWHVFAARLAFVVVFEVI